MEKVKILDVGCGSNPKGHVNVDVSLEYLQREDNKKFRSIKIRNFFLADAHYLPFRDNSFDMVYSSHVLEHCTHPINVLKEFRRVSKQIVYVEIPYCSERGESPRSPSHIYCWTAESFQNLLSRFFPYLEVYTTRTTFSTEKPASEFFRSRRGSLLLLIRKLGLTLLGGNKITAICYKWKKN